jgi:single-strand DNA-binding protein
MSFLNRVVLIGRLCQDVDIRQTSSGTPVGNFTLAVDRAFKKQDGTRDTDFLRIVVWDKAAEACSKYIGKGSLVAIEGRIQSRSYETQDGQKRTAVEVVAENVRYLDKYEKKEETAEEFDPNIGDPPF